MQYENMNASVQLIGNRVLFNVTCTASFNIDVLLVLKYLVTVTIKSLWKVKDKQLPGTDKKSLSYFYFNLRHVHNCVLQKLMRVLSLLSNNHTI